MLAKKRKPRLRPWATGGEMRVVDSFGGSQKSFKTVSDSFCFRGFAGLFK